MSYEKKVQDSASAILERNLTEAEKNEFFRFGAVMGNNNVEDYLYMLMIFKRFADNISKQQDSFREEMKGHFSKIAALEKKIDTTIQNVLAKRADEIARSMGDQIAANAKEALREYEDYHFYQGQTVVITITGILMSLAYALGEIKLLRNVPALLTLPLQFPSGGLAIVGLLAYTYLWWIGRAPDRFGKRWGRNQVLDKATLALLVVILVFVIISFAFSFLPRIQ